MRSSRLIILLTVLVAWAAHSSAHAQRVLVVTTEQELPEQYLQSIYNGEHIVNDLAAAGLPFDVVTYGRFADMDLGEHDVIFLSGHTSPTHVSTVSDKCRAALQEGRKVFVNGDLPHRRYSTSGSLVETNRYALALFNVLDGGVKSVTGTAQLPASIEKDPILTNASMPDGTQFRTFTFNTAPAMTIRYGADAIGFLYPNGGSIDSMDDHALHLLDYGKVANYLRYGSRPQIGFANDRAQGSPIASIEIHADLTNNVAAIDALEQIALQHNIKMTALLVYSFLDSQSIQRWNSISSLFSIGSHSRNHHWDWPPLDINNEVVTALADQKAVIPRTIDYFNFSGQMNPTRQQVEQLYPTGIIFGARGSDPRTCELPSGDVLIVQGIPTRKDWLRNLAMSRTVPFCLSQTMPDDITLWLNGYHYYNELRHVWEANLKYGMYTYGFIHDLEFAPGSNYYTDGMPLADLVRSGIAYMVSQGARFLPTQELMLRLRDFVAGRITSASNPDGSVTVTATRPGALVNEVKIHLDGYRLPQASGNSVVSQVTAGQWVYVTLRPETTSAVTVRWLDPTGPPPPVVTSPVGYISNASVAQWTGEGQIAEYQYAVGSQPGGTEALTWTSAGTSTSAVLSAANLTQGQTYYVSARARYAESVWSDPGSSGALIADLSLPPAPSVTDDGATQSSTASLHATWAASDPESGIVGYEYAIGTTPGGEDVKTFTPTTGTEIQETGLTLVDRETYYVSVKDRNGANLWSAVGSSDGIKVVVPPSAPIVTAPTGYVTSTSVAQWTGIGEIAEYQYAVGTQAGGTDALGWTSAGTSTSASLSAANLVTGTTYYVSVRARYSEGDWSNPGSSGPLLADLTPPPPPSVTDDGTEQVSTKRLHAVWTATDPESGVTDYQYAVGTAPGATDVADWTGTTSTSVTVSGLTLTAGQTYYFSVKARNGADLWSDFGASDGILVRPTDHVTIGTARYLDDGRAVCLEGNVVTAAFTGEFYIEAADTSAGIKVVSDEPVQVGHIVSVTGVAQHDDVERFVIATLGDVIVDGGPAPVKPIFMANYGVAGEGDAYLPGATGALGLNNVGVLVCAVGRVKAVGTGYLYVDDGSRRYGTSATGIKVSLAEPTDTALNDLVMVTGISALELDGAALRRLIRARSSADIVILAH